MPNCYKCKRCGFECDRKYVLKNHLQRKFECPPKLEDISVDILFEELTKECGNFSCTHCGKRYSNRQSKYMHQRQCKGDSKSDNNIPNKHNVQLNYTNSNNNSHNITITNNIVINNSTIKIRDFNCENMSAAPESFIASCFLTLGIRDLLQGLHFDTDFPENRNVRIKSVKRKLMEIYRDNTWNVVNLNEGLEQLLKQGTRIFRHYARKNEEKILEEDMNEDELEDTLKTLHAIEEMNKKYIIPLMTDIQCMLETYRAKHTC